MPARHARCCLAPQSSVLHGLRGRQGPEQNNALDSELHAVAGELSDGPVMFKHAHGGLQWVRVADCRQARCSLGCQGLQRSHDPAKLFAESVAASEQSGHVGGQHAMAERVLLQIEEHALSSATALLDQLEVAVSAQPRQLTNYRPLEGAQIADAWLLGCC